LILGRDTVNTSSHMAKSSQASLWLPGNLLIALGLFLLRLYAKLPLSWLRFSGKALGTVVATCLPVRKRVCSINLRLCFPDLSPEAHRRLIMRHYQAAGMGLFEMAAAWHKPQEEILKLTEVTGLENLREAQKDGRGVLLLSAHFTTLEMTGRCLLETHPFGCLYRRPNQPYLGKVMTDNRRERMRTVIQANDVRRLVRELRNGEVIWYAPDQGKQLKESALIPFFGIPAVTNLATSRILRMGRAALVPFFGFRDERGHYQIRILPELKEIPSDDPLADARKINRLFESWIREVPEQYLWLHKRFKHRGPDLPDLYARETLPQSSLPGASRTS